MTTGSQQRHASRWVLSFLAALVAILATVFGAATASAATTGVAETRVGASNLAVDVLVEPPQRETAGQQLGKDVAEPQIVVATGVATNSGSRIAGASSAAFRAADDPASMFIKNKHLASAGGNQAKFASSNISEVQGWISRGLRSDGVQFLPNGLDDTFRAIVPAGRAVGTRGQSNIRVIVTNDGRVINAFPVNVR